MKRTDDVYPPWRRGLRMPYAVDLLFVQPPVGAGHRLEAAFEISCGKDADTLLLRSDRTIRGMTEALRPVDHEGLIPSLQQSWWWRDAAATVERCKHSILVAEERNTLPHRERFASFQRVLAPVVEALEPAALHWIPTQQFIRPASFLEAIEQVGFEYPALGAVNVRLYAIEGGREEDVLMDTLGLGALGLWDLQCHFHGLAPDRVAMWLLQTGQAQFLGEGRSTRHHGTIPGPDGASIWRLRAEEALMPPKRVLLDVNPGRRHAAGHRG
jgi:Domain of unknown function (DUF4261)